MPKLPDVPACLNIHFKHDLDIDTDMLWRIFVLYTGAAPGDSDLNTFATDLKTSWATNMASLFSSSGTLTEVQVTDLTSPSAARGVWTGSQAGTSGGGAIGAGSAVLVNFTIPRRYRGGKPRVYLPYGASGDLLDAQQWTTGFVGDVVTAWTALMADIEGVAVGPATTTNQVNVSYYENFDPVQNPVTLRWRNIPRPRAVALTDTISSFSVSQTVASQRRRNGRKR